MKNKRIFMALAVLLILVMAVGCAKAPSAVTGSDKMINEPTQEMAKDTEDTAMTEEAAKDMPAVSENKEMEAAEVGKKAEAGYIDLTPEQAKMLIDSTPDLVIVDVSPKYEAGHLPGAVNYYVGDGSLDAAIPDLDMSKPYLVYCHVDSASIAGAEKLIEAGFAPVYRLEGNYSAWVDAGYPIEQ